MQTGMGLVPLTWQELDAWCRRAGYEDVLSPWEAETLRRMSEAYCSQYVQATQKTCPMPYSQEVDFEELDRAAIARKVASALSLFKK